MSTPTTPTPGGARRPRHTPTAPAAATAAPAAATATAAATPTAAAPATPPPAAPGAPARTPPPLLPAPTRSARAQNIGAGILLVIVLILALIGGGWAISRMFGGRETVVTPAAVAAGGAPQVIVTSGGATPQTSAPVSAEGGPTTVAPGWGVDVGLSQPSEAPPGLGRLPIGDVAKLPNVSLDYGGENAPVAVNYSLLTRAVSGQEFDVIVPIFTAKPGHSHVSNTGPAFKLKDSDLQKLDPVLLANSLRSSVGWVRGDGQKILVEGFRPATGSEFSPALLQSLRAVPDVPPAGATRSSRPFLSRPNADGVNSAQPSTSFSRPQQGPPGRRPGGMVAGGPKGRQQSSPPTSGSTKTCPNCGDVGTNVPPTPYKCHECQFLIQ